MNRRLFVPAVALVAAGLTTVASFASGPQIRVQRIDAVQPVNPAMVLPRVEKAVCVLLPVGDSEVSGVLMFEQQGNSVKVTGKVKGLEPGDHGFHVHQFGDLTDMETGKSAGGHMDVGEHMHGKPSDKNRHTGDLGNITADENGVAEVEMTDKVIALNGVNSIVGRGFIVHAKPDDFGQPTGNAGARVAIGVIGVAQDGIK